LNPESGPSPTIFLKPDLGPKVKFTEWVKLCTTVWCQEMSCTGIAAGTRFYHTQNSNHLDQDLVTKHKRSLLVNIKTAECNVSQEKRNYHETI